MPYNPVITAQNRVPEMMLAGAQAIGQGYANLGRGIGVGIEGFRKMQEQTKKAETRAKTAEQFIRERPDMFGFQTGTPEGEDAFEAFLTRNHKENALQHADRLEGTIKYLLTKKSIEEIESQNQLRAAQALQMMASMKGAPPLMPRKTIESQYPGDKYDVTMVPDSENPDNVTVKSVSPRAPVQSSLVPVNTGRRVVMVDNKTGKPTGDEFSVEAPIPAGFEANPAGGGIRPQPGGPQEMEMAAAKEKQETNKKAQTATYTTMSKLIDGLVDEVDDTVTGAAAVKKFAPGSRAMTVSERLDTLRANIGFEKLAAMRAASPTGGALGQVAIQELNFLQKSAGSLNQWQDAKELRRNLKLVKESLDRWHSAAILGKLPDNNSGKSSSGAQSTNWEYDPATGRLIKKG